MRRILLGVMVLLASTLLGLVPSQTSHASPDGLRFPVIGDTNYSDTFLAYRAGQVDNKHHAIDIFAPKHSYLVSPVDGTVSYVGYPQDSWGWYIVIVDHDGYEYHFMHINNDTPGTDDGLGGPMFAYAKDMQGENNSWATNVMPVIKGQHVAYLGDSGNAENTPAHLHFEIIKPEYTNMAYRDIPLDGFLNPFPYLNAATHITAPTPYPALPYETLPYGEFAGNGSVARGNFDADQNSEIITGAGPGGGPDVRVFDDDGKTVINPGFFAYMPDFRGGVDVAAGDVTGDGTDEIITGAGPGGGPDVRVFKKDGTLLKSFYAYMPDFKGGVRVATGDIDGDGTKEIITSPGPGGGPDVRVFRGDGTLMKSFFAYMPDFRGGVDVTSANVSGTVADEIITSPGPGGGPDVRVFSANGSLLSSFFAYEPEFNGGIKVSADFIQPGPYAQIATIPWSKGGALEKIFSGSGEYIKSGYVLEVWWAGNYDIAAGYHSTQFSTGGNRRMSIRQGIN